MAIVAHGASANHLAQAAQPEYNYTGQLVSVNSTENTLKIKGFAFGRTFNLGDPCACTLLGNRIGTPYDLRPGEKVAVTYQNLKGLLVAHCVKEQPMRYEGTARTIDPVAHTLTVRIHGTDKAFQIPDECNFFLKDGKADSLDDIRIGASVTVTYETPSGTLTAWQIEQASTK
jgi:hypothetical protein